MLRIKKQRLQCDQQSFKQIKSATIIQSENYCFILTLCNRLSQTSSQLSQAVPKYIIQIHSFSSCSSSECKNQNSQNVDALFQQQIKLQDHQTPQCIISRQTRSGQIDKWQLFLVVSKAITKQKESFVNLRQHTSQIYFFNLFIGSSKKNIRIEKSKKVFHQGSLFMRGLYSSRTQKKGFTDIGLLFSEKNQNSVTYAQVLTKNPPTEATNKTQIEQDYHCIKQHLSEIIEKQLEIQFIQAGQQILRSLCFIVMTKNVITIASKSKQFGHFCLLTFQTLDSRNQNSLKVPPRARRIYENMASLDDMDYKRIYVWDGSTTLHILNRKDLQIIYNLSLNYIQSFHKFFNLVGATENYQFYFASTSKVVILKENGDMIAQKRAQFDLQHIQECYRWIRCSSAFISFYFDELTQIKFTTIEKENTKYQVEEQSQDASEKMYMAM